MASFITSSNLTTSQPLQTGEFGVVTAGFGVYPTTGFAVPLNGTARLTVLGTAVSQTSSAVYLNSVNGGAVTVGATGALIGAGAGTSGIGGSISGSLTLNNAGEIMGNTGVSLSLSSANASWVAVNSGRISAASAINGHAFGGNLVAGSKVTLDNSGVIEGAGGAGGIALSGSGTAIIANSGTISAASAASAAIQSAVVTDVYNTGTILGDITLSGTAVLQSSGTTLGDIALGAGQDRVRISGLVEGDIWMGNGDNRFHLRDGMVTGIITGGTGSDSYTVYRGDLMIVDNGGINDFMRAYCDIVVTQGIEVTELVGATGLRAVGSGLGEAIIGSAGNDTISGEGGHDNLMGNHGNDQLNGGAGNDRIDGGAGDDLMRGGAGDDLFQLGTGADSIRGGTGTDTLEVMYNDLLTINVVNLATGQVRVDPDAVTNVTGIENVSGSNQADQITGDGLANRLSGGAGNDTIMGGSGADTLIGGAGADVLDGGFGADRFVFSQISDSNSFDGIDQINGFALANDVIDLSLLDAVMGGGDNAFVFVGAAAFSGGGPQVRLQLDAVAHTTAVQVRFDGSLVADMVIMLDNDLMLTASNFIL